MSTTTRSAKTVLVVEDDPWIRSLMADLLAGEGYAVVQASDGKAGLEMAESNEPDVILLDLAMPEKSGLDVLHELKSSKPTRDIPVMVTFAGGYASRVEDTVTIHCNTVIAAKEIFGD